MPKIIYIEHDGNQTEVEATVGDTLMSTAVDNDIDGILADCGGACACATCHCFVDENWLEKVGPANEDENEMLDGTSTERQTNSRLSCQIEISDDLDGLIVRIPEEQ